MKDYKENFNNAISYAVHKLENNAMKMILLGILGSVYVGIAYMVFIVILGTWPGTITKEIIDENGILIQPFNISITSVALFSASAIFPVGIIMIIFLGGSLFTSDNLTMISWITKQKDNKGNLFPFKKIFIKWMYTLLGNILGGIIIGAMCRAADFLSNENYQYVLGYLSGKKILMPWFFSIFSGMLCNILVAGSVWASLAANHSSAKLLLIYFPIWLFAISGFQHIVANGIIFSMTIFYMIEPSEKANVLIGMNFSFNHDAFESLALKTLEEFKKIPNWVSIDNFIFKAIFTNMLPAGFGNWFSGSIILPYTYYYLSGHSKISKTDIYKF